MKKKNKAPSRLKEFIAAKNIVDLLDDDIVSQVSANVIERYETDNQSIVETGRAERITNATNLALQVIKKKNTPWENASNVKLPMLTTASIQFASKAVPAIIQDENVVKAKVIGDDERLQVDSDGKPVLDDQGQQMAVTGEKQKRADRVVKYMNYQLTQDIPYWEEDVDRMMHILPVVGCMFKKTYYDTRKKRCESKLIFSNRIIANNAKSVVEDEYPITEILFISNNDLLSNQRLGLFSEINDSVEDTEKIQHEGEQSQLEHEPSDLAATNEYMGHECLEQHCWFDLDDDGYDEPYVITVHRDSGTVLRIAARYAEDDISTNSKGEVTDIKPMVFYTKYGFLPSFDGGFYDIGFGELLYPLNKSANTLINQIIDAGTLSNMQGGFIGSGIKIKGGDLKFKPGEYKIINNAGQSIANNVYTNQFKEPSMVLFQLLGFVLDIGKDVSALKDVLSEGQSANIPATTMMALVDQGVRQFKSIHKRIHRSLKKELYKLYKLNSEFLDLEEYKRVTDNALVTKEDFNCKDYDIIPVSDPAIITDTQKMIRLQALTGLKGDPLIDQVKLTERYLSGIGVDDYDDLIVEPQPPQPDPLVESQLAINQAQVALLNEQTVDIQERREIDKIAAQAELIAQQSKVRLEAADITSQITKRASESLKNVAQAESEEAGRQNDQYLRELEMAREIATGEEDYEDNTGRVGYVETPPNDTGVPPAPEGLE